MQKNNVNLLIKEKEDNYLIGRLKIILPIAAGSLLFLFILIFIGSSIYSRSNYAQYVRLQKQVENLETKITSQKNTEGLYSLTLSKLKVLEGIRYSAKNLSQIITEIESLATSGISITDFTYDRDGKLSFNAIADSNEALDNFIYMLNDKEDKKKFSDISAENINRTKQASYTFNIVLKVDPSVLIWEN